ncbi:MAG: hypothetical protein SOZ27_07205 [Spirochaetia bacterium]|nr:hypothetical protein [Spirochaetia bacterium]
MKKKFLPVLITVFISLTTVAVLAGYAFLLFTVPLLWVRIVAVAGAVALMICGMIYICLSRIKEIMKEDEDDLSQY